MNLVPKVHKFIGSVRVLLVGVLSTIGILSNTRGIESVPLAKHVKNQFGREASVYDANRDVWIRGYRGKMEQTLIGKYSAGKSLLEIGTGTGRVMSRFSRKHNYYGIDISYEMLKTAKDKASTQKLDVELLVMDGEHLGFRRGAFESVVISRTLKYLQNPYKALLEVKRISKTGGRSLITCETRDSMWHRMLARGSGIFLDIRFSVGEIVGLVQEAGFNTIGMEPIPSLLSPYFGHHKVVRVIDKILSRTRISAWMVIAENEGTTFGTAKRKTSLRLGEHENYFASDERRRRNSYRRRKLRYT